MFENHDSLVEIAIKEMQKKRKPRTLLAIAKEVFEIKGLKGEEAKKALAQFEIDFMLCGNFICCDKKDKKGEILWDLKTRQKSSLLDKEGEYLEIRNEDDEEASKNQLTDSTYDTENEENEEEYDFDTDDNEDEKDDIEEEILLYKDEDEESEEDLFDDNDSEIVYRKK